MAMATPRTLAKTRPAISCCMCLVSFIITLATANKPALVKASSPPSTLVIYLHEDRVPPGQTIVVAASPSGSSSGSPFSVFGTISVFDNPATEDVALNSTILGQSVGQVTIGIDGVLYVAVAYILNTPSYAGTITLTGTGTTSALGSGELTITGGTGDFRWARGYVETLLISDENPADVVLQATIYLRYD